MIFLGFLSFVQLTILPGWLITWRWRAPSWLARVLVAFGLSLLFNHLLVLLLVALGWLGHPVVLGLVSVELLVLLWLLYRSHWAIIPRSVTLLFPDDLSDDITLPRWLGRTLFWLIITAAAAALWTILARVISLNPGVFDLWDDFVSFNHWAVEWYNGIVPSKTQWYPQLVPTNWALAYQIMGSSDIQFFVKAVMGVFPIAILLTFIDLFYRSKRAAFLLGLSFTTVLFLALSSVFIGSGYVDIPVTFFAFLAGAMLLPDLFAKRFIPSHVIMAGVLVAGAGLTKQAGLFTILPLLIWVGLLAWGQKKKWLLVGRRVLSIFLIFGVLIAPWYGYKFWQMQTGRDTSEVVIIESAVVRTIGERTVFGRWLYGVQEVGVHTSGQLLLSAHLASIDKGKLIWSASRQPISSPVIFTIMWGLIILLGLALANPVAGLVILTVVIPFFLIWAAKYSYDFRNLDLALPFFGLAWGFGLIQLIQLLMQSIGSVKQSRDEQATSTVLALKIDKLPYWVSAVALLIVTVVIYWQLSYPAPVLYAINERKMHSIGSASINNALYRYYETNGLDGKIRTMYQPAAYLPKLKDYVIADGSILNLESLNNYEQDPEIYYILWWDSTNNPDALAYIKGQIASGKYTAIFNIGDYRFVKIKAK
jgi:hypothetical protein